MAYKQKGWSPFTRVDLNIPRLPRWVRSLRKRRKLKDDPDKKIKMQNWQRRENMSEKIRAGVRDPNKLRSKGLFEDTGILGAFFKTKN